MDLKTLFEENKKNIIILGGIIVIAIIVMSVLGSLPKSKSAKVLEVKFDSESIQVEENKTYQVKYTILPISITDATLTWTTTNEQIASVDENGLISAHMPGSVIIVGKSESGAYDNLNVVVVAADKDQTAVKFNIENFDLKINTSRRLYTIFTPSDISYEEVEWSSSNELAATVTQGGMVNGVKEGKTVITAKVKLSDGNYLSTSSNVTVTKKTTLSLSKGNSVSIENGSSLALTLTISDQSVAVKQIVGETSNNNIVQIIRRPLSNDDGTISLTIKAMGIGKCNLTFNLETTDGEIVNLSVPVTVK